MSILVAALAVLLVWFAAGRWLQARNLWAIPSPDGIYVFWGRKGLPSNAPDTMRGWAREYGELFRLRIGWYDWVVVNSPEAFKAIFDKQVRNSASNICLAKVHDTLIIM